MNINPQNFLELPQQKIKNNVANYLIFSLNICFFKLKNCKIDDVFKKTFNSWSEYEIEFQKWCDVYYQPAVNIIRSSKLMSESDPISKKFKYNFVVNKCHAGSVREGKVDNSRPNQQTECIGCNDFQFKLFYN